MKTVFGFAVAALVCFFAGMARADGVTGVTANYLDAFILTTDPSQPSVNAENQTVWGSDWTQITLPYTFTVQPTEDFYLGLANLAKEDLTKTVTLVYSIQGAAPSDILDPIGSLRLPRWNDNNLEH